MSDGDSIRVESNRWWRRWARGSREARIRREFHDHLSACTRDLIESGLDPAAASAEARARFGDLQSWIENCRLERSPAETSWRRAFLVASVALLAAGIVAAWSWTARQDSDASLQTHRSLSRQLSTALKRAEDRVASLRTAHRQAARDGVFEWSGTRCFRAATAAVGEGRHDDAVFLFDLARQKMTLEPEYRGVRGSFLISSLSDLAARHQPAAALLADWRDEAERRIEQTPSGSNLQEFIAISRGLHPPDHAAAVAAWESGQARLDADPAWMKACDEAIRPSLLAEQRYAAFLRIADVVTAEEVADRYGAEIETSRGLESEADVILSRGRIALLCRHAIGLLEAMHATGDLRGSAAVEDWLTTVPPRTLAPEGAIRAAIDRGTRFHTGALPTR